MIGSIDVGAGVRDSADLFDGPALTLRVDEVLRPDAKELLHLVAAGNFVRSVTDLGGQRLAGSQVLERDAEVDDAVGRKHPGTGFRRSRLWE